MDNKEEDVKFAKEGEESGEANHAQEESLMPDFESGKNPPNIKLKMEENPTKKGKSFIIVVFLTVVVLAVAGFFLSSILTKSQSTQSVTFQTPSPTPEVTPTPNPLDRSQWSIEVLNGTAKSGLAKTIGSEIQSLGYPVVKVGNADKSTYAKTEILVKKELLDKVDLVIADLKDTLKIASAGGELKDSTASARIIIGKDSI